MEYAMADMVSLVFFTGTSHYILGSCMETIHDFKIKAKAK
ncbi:MAG: hypothetical protein PWQ60_1385 [Thermoanaerobacteraceae bacterium]|nr:hypothetical protein [Thermoanaerobacteraceae bacterium]